MHISCCRSHRLLIASMVMIASVSTGCRTNTWKMPTWKMPGSNFFAKREPDAATLAGNNSLPKLPESPAAKYTADQLAATSGSSANTGMGSTATRSDLASKANGFPGSSTSIYGATPGGYGSMPSSPYKLSSTTPSPSTLSPATAPSPSTALGQTTPNPSASIPYGGTGYGTPSPSASPNSALASMPSPYGGSSSFPAPGNTASLGGANPAYPPLPNATVGGVVQSSYPGATVPPSYPSASAPGSVGYGVGGSGSATGPAMPPLAAFPAATQGGSSNPTATAGGSPSSAYQGATTLGAFAPGSTGRSTAYDFSGGATAPTATTSTTTRPTYSLPPNTAAVPGAQLR